MHRTASERRLLAVLHNQGVEHFAVLKRLTHDGGVGNAHAIIAESDCAAVVHGADLRKFFSLPTFCDCANGENVCQPNSLGFAHDKFDLALVIQRWLGVGHATNGGEARSEEHTSEL